jgi:hypothetical protein
VREDETSYPVLRRNKIIRARLRKKTSRSRSRSLVQKITLLSRIMSVEKKRAAPHGRGPSLGRKRQSHGRERTNLSLATRMAWGAKAAQQETPPWKAGKPASSTQLLNKVAALAGEASWPP